MPVKRCRDCGQTKPVNEFWKRKASEDGLALYCKDCFSLRNYASKRKRMEGQGKEFGPYQRRRVVPEGMKHCPRCKEFKPLDAFGHNRASRDGLTSYCKPCHSVVMAENKRRKHGSVRNYLLKLRYRITAEQVEEHRAAQGGICAICLRKEASHVDHDHMTGLFRGLLCFPCNGALGQYDDDPARMREAANYLEGISWLARSMLLEFGSSTINWRVIADRSRGLRDQSGSRIQRVGTSRDDHLRNRYGIGEGHARQLRLMQRDLCAVCCDDKAEHIDHDHVTGAVRGILCGGCNAGMGQLGDDPVSLRRAADYVLGGLVRQVPASDGMRFSITYPDVDPRTVPLGGWEPYRVKDGEHRKLYLEIDEGMYTQTRLKLAPSEQGFCRRNSYTGPRPALIDRFRAMLDANPEHARRLDELLARG